MFRLVKTPDEAIANLQRFDVELSKSPELQNRLAFARAWYAWRGAGGEWQFGPSKFIGYEGINAQKYISTAQHLDGRQTEAQLRQWAVPLHGKSAEHDEMDRQLFAFLAKYGKAPSTKHRLSILSGSPNAKSDAATESDPNSRLVELLIAVASSLPATHRDKLRRALQ